MYAPHYQRERKLVWLRQPKLCWLRETLIDRPIKPHPCCMYPFTEVVGYTIGSDTVIRLFWLDHHGPPVGHLPATARDVPDARLVNECHAGQPAPHPLNRGGWTGKADLRTETRWSEVFRQYWTARAIIKEGKEGLPSRSLTLRDYVLQHEIAIIPVVDCYRRLPWAMEEVHRAYDWQRDSWPDRIVVAYSRGGTHSRVWYVPPGAVDQPPPRGAINPKSITIRTPSKRARRRWLPVPQSVRLSI